MPTFTTVAFDRFLEPEASKSMAPVKDVPDPQLARRNSTSSSRLDRGTGVPPLRLEKRSSLPHWKLENKNDPSAMKVDRNNHWTQISPALYATPKETPVPDSPSSYPPSPYIINHKRRGPRLLKSFSEHDVSTSPRALDEQKKDENAKKTETKVGTVDDIFILREAVDLAKSNRLTSAVHGPVKDEYENHTSGTVKDEDVNSTFGPIEEHVHGSRRLVKQEYINGTSSGESQGSEMVSGSAEQKDTLKSVLFDLQKKDEVGDFSDPQDPGSVKGNTESNANGGLQRSMSLTTPVAEFYDAWEELTSESGPQLPVSDVEAELREIRLSLLMEIERRKQAEEALNSMQTQWQRIQSQLSSVGLTLPADLAVAENEHPNDLAKDLSQQFYIARVVSNSIGRGTAKAEAEMEMEAQLELKNFEIARLYDRLHYYEAVNREMSQRNQVAVDTARRLRQKRKRRQRWVWGSIAAVITVGSAVLAWPYLSIGKGTSSSHQSRASEGSSSSEGRVSYK